MVFKEKRDKMSKIRECLHGLDAPQTLFFTTILGLLIPNVALCFTEGMPVLACLTNVLLPLSAYWLLMTLSRVTGKMTWICFPLIFFAAFQIVLLYLFGHSVIAVDMFLNLVTTNTGEAMELLDNLLFAVGTVVVLYVPLLVQAAFQWRKHRALTRGFVLRQRRYALFCMVAGVVFIGASYGTDRHYRAELHLYPVNVFNNLGLAIERTVQTAEYKETSAGFRFHSVSTHDKNEREVYVLVIGETARSLNFQLYGYRRPTTPLLMRTGGLTVFTKALTQSNTTHKSVPMLMSAASAEDFNRIYKEKGIIAAFREAGFHTVFVSAQRPNHSFIDFFGEEADEWVFIREKVRNPDYVMDKDMLPYVDRALRKGYKKELIVLHSYGSHFNYRERYPRDETYFRPDDATEAKASNRSQLLNAYDNTIRYTDSFLHALITRLDSLHCASALLYTSDHGENIFDDRRKLFLHASPTPSEYELHVPFLVWTSAEYARLYPQNMAAMRANRLKPMTNSASTFHTMLNLAGICTQVLADSLSVASPRFKVRPYHYLNDHNEYN